MTPDLLIDPPPISAPTKDLLAFLRQYQDRQEPECREAVAMVRKSLPGNRRLWAEENRRQAVAARGRSNSGSSNTTH